MVCAFCAMSQSREYSFGAQDVAMEDICIMHWNGLEVMKFVRPAVATNVIYFRFRCVKKYSTFTWVNCKLERSVNHFQISSLTLASKSDLAK